jgi:GntR family transcriptional regulator
MILNIDPHSSKPVYQQLIDQIKYAIASGRLCPGDRLDPIRDVAVQTRVNRNTVARAYMELEREGVIRSKTGQGSFVGDGSPGDGSPEFNAARARRVLSEKIDELLAQAHHFRLSEAELQDLLRERMEKIRLQKDEA